VELMRPPTRIEFAAELFLEMMSNSYASLRKEVYAVGCEINLASSRQFAKKLLALHPDRLPLSNPIGELLTASSRDEAGNAARGKELFVKDGCYGCHGYVALGGSTSRPRLAPVRCPGKRSRPISASRQEACRRASRSWYPNRTYGISVLI
jgi:hypothetical protein